MPEDDLLQSWKEIAAYLGRSERTCRRWETEFQLPIHRMDGSVRASVFAYKSELDRWMDEILHEETREPPSKKRTLSRGSLIIVLTLAIIPSVTIAVMVLRGGRSEPPNPPPSTKPTLAILPFTNNTGDESLDFWENALADLLVSDLSQSRYLNVLSQDRVFFVLRDLGQLEAENGDAIDLEEVAARAKVDNVVVGNFVQAGRRFRIAATVRHNSTGQSVVLQYVEARSEEEIFLRIDELSNRIKNHLVSPADANDRDLDLDIGTITTSSLEAYRYFVEGRSSWENGRAIDAVESFEKAVAIDPEFATAYSWMALCYRNLPGHEDKAEESITRAFELSHHASPRERFTIQGRYYLFRGRRSWAQAFETYLEFVRVYPDDYFAVLRLGDRYLAIEEWEKGIETLERLKDDEMYSSHIAYLCRAYCALGQYETALEMAKGPEANTGGLLYHRQLTTNLIYERSFDAALLEADKMLERIPGYAFALTVKGDVHFFRAEWDQAEVYYRELLNPVGSDNRRMWSRLGALKRLAYLYLARGQFERALDFLNQGIEEVTALGERKWLPVFRYHKTAILLDQGDLSGADAEIEVTLADSERANHVSAVIGSLHLRGMILIELGDIRGAEQAADEMKAEIEGWVNAKLMRRWYRLMGHIALARNDVGRAVEHFEQAISLLPDQHRSDGDGHAVYYSSLAYAYYLSGDMEKAQEWYEKILALTTGRLYSGDIYAKSHFMLGRINEALGTRAEAVRGYRTFLDLWRDADPGVAEVDQAKRSLAVLLD